MHLQSALRALSIPLPKYGVDGIFGRETLNAVRQAQQKFGLPPTGMVDSQLIRRLGIPNKSNQMVPLPQQQGSRQSTLWLLAGIITLAAGIAIKKATRK